ncbi:hypothetical protein Tco_0154461 [Tanacetum coccineum]
MDTTRAEQIALDDALVAPANRLKIGKSNLRLSSDLKSKEATLQVVYDVLKLTPFYKAFQISAHHSIRFKMKNKKHIVNLEYFRAMLQICPKLPNQQFKELPFEEAILTFLRDLGHSAQILWGMYHKKNVDYAYLLWEDFVYQVENKNVKKSNEMYYPRFTKVIVNFFITKDQSIPRRNSVNWHYARDDYMFTTIKAIASGAEPPKTKASVKKKQIGSDKTTTSSTTKGKRLKTSAKTAKPAKKKQPAKTSMDKGLTVLSEVALTEAEQLKLVIEISKIQTHNSHASGSGADEGTGAIPGVPDVPTYNSDDEQISWKSSKEDNDNEVNVSEDDDTDNDDYVEKDINDNDADNQDDDQEHDDQDDEANDDAQDKGDQDDENQDDDNEQTDSDNDGDDFVYPKFSTHDDEERDKESFDPRVLIHIIVYII